MKRRAEMNLTRRITFMISRTSVTGEASSFHVQRYVRKREAEENHAGLRYKIIWSREKVSKQKKSRFSAHELRVRRSLIAPI